MILVEIQYNFLSMNNPSSAEPPILTVSQLSNAIKHSLESAFPLVWLQGEISNFKNNTSGHLYFSLKDASAQISAVMFRGDAASLKQPLKDGAQVIIRGEINVYPLTGKYQIIVRELKPVGVGELLLRLEELKIKLHKLGWFNKERKRPLPRFPKRIGVVTSPTGAVIQDILNVLSRRFSGFHLILNPVKVQGEGAAQEIAQAINEFNKHDLVDVMIIGRGGGSIEDLWAFNEEIVAQAIFNSRIPTICAVGHETDHCIADYVADVRAPTPSAAAEIVIAEKMQQMNLLTQFLRRMQQTVYQLIRHDRQRVVGIMRHPVIQSPYNLLGPWIQQVDLARQDIDAATQRNILQHRLLLKSKQSAIKSLNPTMRLKHYKEKMVGYDKSLKTVMKRKLDGAQLVLKHLKDSLDALNPKNVLTKGYCILFSEKDNSAITSVHSVKKSDPVQIFLSDGILSATIDDTIASEHTSKTSASN